MSHNLDSLPVFDASTLPTVFATTADRARTEAKLSERKRRHTSKNERQVFASQRKQCKADAILERLPTSGEVLHLCLDGAFDLANLIPRIVELSGETCDNLDLMTLGFNDATLEILSRLTDAGSVKAIRLLCSHYFRSADTDLWARAHHELTHRGHRLFVARTHAKIQCYRFASGRCLTLMSSANLRSCKNAEFVVLFPDEPTLTFWQNIITELIEEAERCAAK